MYLNFIVLPSIVLFVFIGIFFLAYLLADARWKRNHFAVLAAALLLVYVIFLVWYVNDRTQLSPKEAFTFMESESNSDRDMLACLVKASGAVTTDIPMTKTLIRIVKSEYCVPKLRGPTLEKELDKYLSRKK